MHPGVVYFLCQSCGHNLAAYRALADANLWTGGSLTAEDAAPFASRMRCSKCKSKTVSVHVQVAERPTEKVVATDRGVNRVYHRFDCPYAVKINLEDLVEFESEDAAIKQAYVACGHCFKTTTGWYGPRSAH